MKIADPVEKIQKKWRSTFSQGNFHRKNLKLFEVVKTKITKKELEFSQKILNNWRKNTASKYQIIFDGFLFFFYVSECQKD